MKQRKGDVANGIQIAALPSGQQMGPQCREIQGTTSSREHKDTVPLLLLPLLLPSSYQAMVDPLLDDDTSKPASALTTLRLNPPSTYT
ncbi:unnamed protein product [Lampetra planeri]